MSSSSESARAGGDAPLECIGVGKVFSDAGQTLRVLDGVNLVIGPRERIAIVGPSGAGKTTLLQILGGLDDPSEGRVCIFGRDLARLGHAERGRVRNRTLGFVYQFHHLLPEFTALENVAMPLLIRRLGMGEVTARARLLLEKVGLGGRLQHKPGELSGGERQRVAVARALVTEPAVVLADEPTGNLDRRTGERVLELMLALNSELGASLVIVTHDEEIAVRMQRIVRLEDGVLKDVSSEFHGGLRAAGADVSAGGA